MKTLTLLLGLSTGLFNPVHAQQAARARSLLDKVYKTYQKQRDIDMQFDYELYNEQANVHQKSSGVILIKGDKYALDFMGVERRFDGDKLYTILPEDREVNISSQGDASDPLRPDELLKHYRERYTLSWDIQQRVAGQRIQFIKLQPKHQSDTRYILIGIEMKSHSLYQIINTDKKGVVTTLTITAYKTNQDLSDKRFTFDEHQYPNYLLNHLE